MAFFEDIKQSVSRAAQSMSDKNRENREISKLNNEGKAILVEMEGIFTQIGRAYVDSNGEPNETLSALTCRIAELRGKLDELERQKLAVKNQNVCPVCGAVMPKDARFCSNCGEKMPEPEPEPAKETIEEPAAEAGEEASAEAAVEAEAEADESAGEEVDEEEAPDDADDADDAEASDDAEALDEADEDAA